jgi:osmotically-inducible protein OsmY
MAERYDEQYRSDRDRAGRGNDRGFMERAGDEVKSWFGDDEAERRRHMDDPQRDRDRDTYRERQLGQNTEYRGGQDYRGYEHRGQGYQGGEFRGQESRGQRYGGDDYERSRAAGGSFRGVSEYGSRYGSNYDTGQSGSNYGAGSNYGSGPNYGYSSGASYGGGYSSFGPGSSQSFQGYGQGTGDRANYGQGNRDASTFGQSGYETEGSRPRGSFAGRGPKGYQRSDARISEDVCDRLAESPDVDASNIEVKVENGEVTLAGSVADRGEKRRAEDLIENISGVREVHNHIRVNRGQGGQNGQDDGLGRTSVLGLNTGPNAGATGGSTDRPTNVTAGASGAGASDSGAGAGSSAALNTGDSANPGITGGGPSGATDISNTSPSSVVGKTSTAGGRR